MSVRRSPPRSPRREPPQLSSPQPHQSQATAPQKQGNHTRRRETAETFGAVEDDDDDDNDDLQASFDLEEEYGKRVEWLRKTPLFNGLSDDAAEQGVSDASVDRFLEDLVRKRLVPDTKRSGTMIIKKGAVSEVMFFLERGDAEVLLELGEPPVATLGEGDFFGENALFDGGKRNAHVRCVASSLVPALSLLVLCPIVLS